MLVALLSIAAGPSGHADDDQSRKALLRSIGEEVDGLVRSGGDRDHAEALVEAVDRLRAAGAGLGASRFPDAFVGFYEVRAVRALADWGASGLALDVAESALERSYEPLDLERWRQRVAVTSTAADIARLAGRREDAQRLIDDLNVLVPRGKALDAPPHELAWELFVCATFGVALTVERGLPDDAIKRIPELEELRREYIRHPLADAANRRDSWYFIQRTRMVTLLALDRIDDTIALSRELRKDPEYENLQSERRLALEQCAALAAASLSLREGRAAEESGSPFAPIFADPDFGSLSRDERAEAYLVEAAFQLEHAGLDAAREPTERWQALVDRWSDQPQSHHVAVRGWALRARTLALSLAAGRGGSIEELEAVRAGFRDMLERARELTQERPTAVLHYAELRELLVELCFAGRNLLGDDVALERFLEDVEAVEALGLVARRMQAGASADWREAFADADVGGLLFVPAFQRGAALLLRGGELELVELPGAARIDRARRALSLALSEFVRSEGARAGDALGRSRREMEDLLLPPQVRERIADWKRLVIVSPELVGHVPFELLEIGTGRALGLEMPVEYWPSLSVQSALRERPTPMSSLELALCVRTQAVSGELIGNATFAVPDATLDVWRDRITSDRMELALEEDATVEWLAAEAADAGTLWIVAHGVFRPAEAPASGLAIPSADGSRPWLRPDDERWNPSADWPGIRVPPLVVLAACGAWRAPFRRGNDGGGHLPTRFLESGARAVILPFHDLRLEDHHRFAVAFLDAVEDGAVDAGSALQKARLALHATADDPLAAIAPLLFHLDGLSDTLVPIRVVDRRGDRYWTILAAAGAAAVIAILGVFLRRRRPTTTAAAGVGVVTRSAAASRSHSPRPSAGSAGRG